MSFDRDIAAEIAKQLLWVVVELLVVAVVIGVLIGRALR